jgi:hypothetical protein
MLKQWMNGLSLPKMSIGLLGGAAVGLMVGYSIHVNSPAPVDRSALAIASGAQFEALVETSRDSGGAYLDDITVYPAEGGRRLVTAILRPPAAPPQSVYFAAPEPYGKRTDGSTGNGETVTEYLNYVRYFRPETALSYAEATTTFTTGKGILWGGAFGLLGLLVGCRSRSMPKSGPKAEVALETPARQVTAATNLTASTTPDTAVPPDPTHVVPPPPSFKKREYYPVRAPGSE